MKTFLAALYAASLLPAALCADTRLLAVMPMTGSFHEAIEGMNSDLGGKYSLSTFDVDKGDAADELLRTFRSSPPDGLVLMDAKAILLAKDLQKRDTLFSKIPKFVLMTLKAEYAIEGLNNAAGIKFEVPAYTIFTNLNIISRKEFRKIGVFYRRGFSGFIEESKRFLAKEKMELIGKCLDCDQAGTASPDAILKGLKQGMEDFQDGGVEVVWMLADNALVNASTLKAFWVPRFRSKRTPLVVPLANLASLESGLGMFSAYPDFLQLGVQAAQQVIQVFEENANPGEIALESLISVRMILNEDVANKIGWDLRPEKLERVKTILRRK